MQAGAEEPAEPTAHSQQPSDPSGWRTWWPRPAELQKIGKDPDYRFTLANERTFLAWIRTSLALLAGGIAVVQLVPSFSIPAGRHLLGIPLVLLSIVLSVYSYQHWASSERAMRLRKSLPPSPLPPILGIAIALISLLALVIITVSSNTK